MNRHDSITELRQEILFNHGIMTIISPVKQYDQTIDITFMHNSKKKLINIPVEKLYNVLLRIAYSKNLQLF